MQRFNTILIIIALLHSIQCDLLKLFKRDSDQATAVVHHDTKHWGYRNEDKSLLPHNWHKTHPKCYGKQQSPIDITFHSTEFDSNLKQIEIVSELKDVSVDEKWQITNNGHSVVLTPLSKDFQFINENESYKLLQMHFHWRGSEHFINGRKFAGELHMVHQSKNNSNRFAVLGFLIEQLNDNNPLMDPIVTKLIDVIKYKSSSEINDLKLDTLRPTKLNRYFRYSGSLTTPACDEVVEWFVMDSPVLYLSDDQLLEFQALEDSHGYPILMNSRPIQKLNDRLVRRSFASASVFRGKSYLRSASGYNKANSVYSNSFYISFSSILCAIILVIKV